MCNYIGCCSNDFGLTGIGYRHGQEWSEVRAAIRTYGDKIKKASNNAPEPLSSELFEKLKLQIIPSPIELRFPHGDAPVHLRMAHAIYHYVGVDFGNGANAFYEPATMYCTYAD